MQLNYQQLSMTKETDTTTKSVKVKFEGTSGTVVVGYGSFNQNEVYEYEKEAFERDLKGTNLFTVIK